MGDCLLKGLYLIHSCLINISLQALPGKPGKEKKGPACYLGPGKQEGNDQTNPGASGNTRRGLPVAYGKINGQRCRDDGKGEYDQGNDGQSQGDTVIERPVVLEILDPPSFSATIQTGSAPVPAIELHITQRTQEPSAGRAWDHRLLSRMVETACLIIHKQQFTGCPRRKFF